MLIGIHTGRYSLLTKYVQKYIDILTANDIKYVLLDSSSPDFWEEIKEVDYFIFHYAHYDWDKQVAEAILPIIQNEYGIKCHPEQRSCWQFNDKIKEYYLLKSHGLPMTESWVFYDKKKAMNWIKTCDYPIVFKLRKGSGGNNVLLIKNIKDAKRAVRIMFTRGVRPNGFRFRGSIFYKDFNIAQYGREIANRIVKRIKSRPIDNYWGVEKGYILFQKFLPNNRFDTRVTVMGNRAFTYVRFNRANDFRSICEMSYATSDFLLNGSPGYWDDKLKWHSGHYWPQYFDLVDLLGIELKQPE